MAEPKPRIILSQKSSDTIRYLARVHNETLGRTLDQAVEAAYAEFMEP